MAGDLVGLAKEAVRRWMQEAVGDGEEDGGAAGCDVNSDRTTELLEKMLEVRSLRDASLYTCIYIYIYIHTLCVLEVRSLRDACLYTSRYTHTYIMYMYVCMYVYI